MTLQATTSVARARPAAEPFNDSLSQPAGKGSLFTVVIDAGHGGKDPGGMGANSQEKHIALNIATLLSEGIRNRFPEVTIILTRDDDTFIPLYERAAIANRAGADLFVSIHANIMPGSSATYGTETFVMGQHVAEHNLAVAKRENASVLLEADYEKNYDYDPNSDEGHIIMSMFQHAFLERSIDFAGLVEREFAGIGRKSRGVKQAGFVVLKETTMPAVLVETGFMSNANEETYLLSPDGQSELAEALLLAFGKYYRRTGRANESVVTNVKRAVFAKPAAAVGPTVRPKVYATAPTSTAPTVRPAPASAPRTVLRKEVTTKGGNLDTISPFKFPTADSKDERIRRSRPKARGVDMTTVPDSELTYALQLFAVTSRANLNHPKYILIPYPIREVREDGFYKYQIRGLNTPDDVARARQAAKEAGIHEMMNVVYYRGKRLPQPTVRYLLAR